MSCLKRTAWIIDQRIFIVVFVDLSLYFSGDRGSFDFSEYMRSDFSGVACRFVYDVELRLPDRKLPMLITVEGKSQANAAKDSAASLMLNELEKQGFSTKL
jgi:hypothetical protein